MFKKSYFSFSIESFRLSLTLRSPILHPWWVTTHHSAKDCLRRRQNSDLVMRKLKHHEQRLLKKVNFLEWKNENNARELQVMRRYHITERDDYSKWVIRQFAWWRHSCYGMLGPLYPFYKNDLHWCSVSARRADSLVAGTINCAAWWRSWQQPSRSFQLMTPSELRWLTNY